MRLVILFGPYRNLTTLWSSILGLHPKLLVLNHITPEVEAAVADIVEAKLAYSDLVSLLLNSIGREEKPLEKSHALRDSEELKQVYYKWREVQTDVSHILWKDSGRLTKEFRSRPGQLKKFVEAYPNVQFLLPLRNPVDVVRSNMEKTTYLQAYDVPISGYIDFIHWYLDVLQWFMRWVQRDKSRFQYLQTEPFQTDRGTWQRLMNWLGLPSHDTLLQDMQQSLQVRPAVYGFHMQGDAIRSYLKFRLRLLLHHLGSEHATFPMFLDLLRQVVDSPKQTQASLESERQSRSDSRCP